MIHPLAAKPSLQGLRALPARSTPSRRPLRVQSIMGNYQYKVRAEKLRQKGVDVYEWGSRALREGCFGEDVLQLQNWLSDEYYYNPVDGGYTGYFGSVTKEALQAWQRDNGIAATGNFDAASKWTYIRNLEASATQSHQAASAFMQNASTAVPSGAMLSSSPSSAPAFGTPLLAAAALVAAIAFSRVATPLLRRAKTLITKSLTRSTQEEAEEYAEHAETFFNEEEEAVALAQAVAPPTPSRREKQQQRESRLRRLSNEELQRYIAPFKKGSKETTTGGIPRPAPQRSAPRRPLILTPEEASATQGAVSSRHGTYYGGRQVLDRVKQYLAEQGNGPSASPGSKRMQSTGYDMRAGGSNVNSSRSNQVSSTPSRSSSENRARAPPTPQQPKMAPVGGSNQQAPALNPLKGSLIGSSFEDIPVEALTGGKMEIAPGGLPGAAPSQALLSGTDLEALPESPLRPVPVQRAGSSRPTTPQARVPNTRKGPVAVVKPAMPGQERAAPAKVPAAPLDPNAPVVVQDRPVKLVKPARLASKSILSDDE